MNGGVFVESEPAAECLFLDVQDLSFFAFQIDRGDALANVPIVSNFELSFTLFLNEPFDDDFDGYKQIIIIKDPNNPKEQETAHRVEKR